MRIRRLATTGVALATALSLGLTGCVPTATRDAASPSASASSAPADPRAELTAALEQLNKQSAQVELVSPIMNASGALDPLSKTSDMTLDMGAMGKMQMVSSGDDVYLKMSGKLAGPSDKWLHLDIAKLGDDSQLKTMADGDPGNVTGMIKSIVAVERTGPGSFAGTLDYTKSVGEDSDLVQTFGDKAAAVPFTATVDADGRLTELIIDMTALDPSLGEMRVTYFNFGSPVTVRTPPASEVETAPAELLDAFDT
ncbi:hypothetical protein [Micromonospora sp. NPDC051296]|uniref:hypothetical protein n=1 Tax=Micromonospora sp. NPDC051296 TaxID=3155046 RepID=UPI0034408EC8